MTAPPPGLVRCAPVVLGADSEWSRGAFGSVHVVDAPAGRVAVKRVPELAGHVNRELETCMRLASDPHPNVVQLLGYWTEDDDEERKRTLYLVMEFVPETLRSVAFWRASRASICG